MTKLKSVFRSEWAIGLSLFLASFLALVFSNSSNAEIYSSFFAAPFFKSLTLRDFINDGLMAIFFLLVGLELKREILIGELSSKEKMILPALAALGGIIFPALIFIFFNFGEEESLRGFAIPCATDIAFAYGIISLFGRKISSALRIFIVSLAVLDDLAAIVIIAIFYSHDLNFSYLALAFLPLFFLAILNFFSCQKISFYLICGFVLWLMILKSGIHPTLAGVLTALFVPIEINGKSLLAKLAHKISPSVNFLILPIFAFANAGVKIENFSLETFTSKLALGVMFGLFFGKQIGVMLFSFIAIKLKISHLPRGTNWFEFYGAAIFTGIGFTMSLFIANLALIEDLSALKIGILSGSFLAILFGSFVTLIATKSSSHK